MVCAWPPRNARRGRNGSPKTSGSRVVAGDLWAVGDCGPSPTSGEVGLGSCIYNGFIIPAIRMRKFVRVRIDVSGN